MKTESIKTRKWTTVLPLPFFDENNPFAEIIENTTIEKLEQLKEFNGEKIKIAISPRHYSLIDGKKTNHHRHIIFEFANPRYYSPRIKEEIKAEKFGFNRVDPVRRSDNLERYFLHLDDQSKSQHSKEEIIYLNGMKEFVYETKTKSEIKAKMKVEVLNFVMDFLKSNPKADFIDLTNFVKIHHEEHLPVFINMSYMVNRLLAANARKNSQKKY